MMSPDEKCCIQQVKSSIQSFVAFGEVINQTVVAVFCTSLIQKCNKVMGHGAEVFRSVSVTLWRKRAVFRANGLNVGAGGLELFNLLSGQTVNVVTGKM